MARRVKGSDKGWPPMKISPPTETRGRANARKVCECVVCEWMVCSDYPSRQYHPLPVGAISPVSTFSVLLLPAPLIPRNPNVSPGGQARDMPRTACFG